MSLQRTLNSVSRNSFWQMVTVLARTITIVAVRIAIARVFEAEELGRYTFVLTAVLVFTFLSDFGIGLLLVREVARVREQVGRYVGQSLGIVAITGSFTVLCIVVALAAAGYPPVIIKYATLAGLGLAATALAAVFRGAFHAFEQMKHETFAAVLQEFFFLVFALIAVLARGSLTVIFGGYLISRLLGLGASAYLYQTRYGKIQLLWEWPFCKSILRDAWPFALNVALSTVYLQVDVLMVSYFKGDADVGFYTGATLLVGHWTLLAIIINTSMMPILSRLHSTAPTEVDQHGKRLLKWLFILSAPLCVWFAAYAEFFTMAVLGKAFAPSVFAVQLLAMIIPLKFLDHGLATVLTAKNLQRQRTSAIAVAAVANVGMNLWAVSKYSFKGAAVTTVLTEVILFVLLAFFLRKYISAPTLLKTLWKPALCLGIMGASTVAMVRLPVVVGLLGSAIAYGAALWLLGVVRKKEAIALWEVARPYIRRAVK